jgi:hypothetical protein
MCLCGLSLTCVGEPIASEMCRECANRYGVAPCFEEKRNTKSANSSSWKGLHVIQTRLSLPLLSVPLLSLSSYRLSFPDSHISNSHDTLSRSDS